MVTKYATNVNQTSNNNSSENQEMFSAVLDNKIDKLKSFLKQPGYDINATNETINTPLNLALASGNLEAALILLAKGADVNIVNRKGLSPLHTLIKNIENYIKQGADMEDILELAKKMITDGANVQCQERRGNTIINFIAQKAKASQATTDLYTKIGLMVLSYDKDTEQTVKIKNNMGKTPLDYLSRNGNTELRNAVYDVLPQGRAHAKRMQQKKEHATS